MLVGTPEAEIIVGRWIPAGTVNGDQGAVAHFPHLFALGGLA
jgi:hypothetical protein